MRSKNVQGRRPRAGNGGQAVWNVRFAAGHALDQGGTAEALSDESFSAELAVPAFVAADCRSPHGTCRCPMRLIADDLRSAFPWSASGARRGLRGGLDWVEGAGGKSTEFGFG
jgi:hypothetical protein